MDRVGAYEAKTHLAELLRRVERGEIIIITRHGRDVARLVPTAGVGASADLVAAVRNARRGVRLGAIPVREMIDEGRR